MTVVGDGVAFAKELRERGEKQCASNEARIQHRLAIKEQMAADFAPMLRGDVEAEVLIRDADRQPDGWPEPDRKFRLRRLSPWFKVGVMRAYSNGMTAVLRLDCVLIEDGIARQPYVEVRLYRQYSEGVWLPIDDVEYKPAKASKWREYLWHRESRKLERENERERKEWIRSQEEP